MPPGTVGHAPPPAEGLKAAKPDKMSSPGAWRKEVEKGAQPEALETWRTNIRGVAGLGLPRPASWWTGAAPEKAAGWVEKEGALTSLPLPVRGPE